MQVLRLKQITNAAIFFLLLLNPLFLTVAAQSYVRLDCFIVSNAKIAIDNSRKYKKLSANEKFLYFANEGHQIEQGNSSVFAIRKFEDNGTGVDVQEFTKLTLELKYSIVNLLLNETRNIDVQHAYFSAGSIGFIHRGDYWTSRNAVKSIKLTHTKKGWIAIISSTLEVSRSYDNAKKMLNINQTCPVKIVDVNSLSSWDGLRGFGWEAFSPIQ